MAQKLLIKVGTIINNFPFTILEGNFNFHMDFFVFHFFVWVFLFFHYDATFFYPTCELVCTLCWVKISNEGITKFKRCLFNYHLDWAPYFGNSFIKGLYPWVNAQYGGSFFKIIIFQKSPDFTVKILIFCGTIG